ncbi:MAG: N-acetyltransferase family protein [Parvularculaceae bacterium]
MSASVRKARGDDAAGINAVYNPFIRESAATFETEEHDDAWRRAWIEERGRRHPAFVAADGERIVGFANAAPFDPRGAYETSVKVSVFLAPVSQGKGVGRALYAALFEALAGADVHRAYGLIVAPNPASVALHEAFGFTRISTLSEVGRKFGRFWDVMWFEKRF